MICGGLGWGVFWCGVNVWGPGIWCVASRITKASVQLLSPVVSEMAVEAVAVPWCGAAVGMRFA
ncbi:hypothetical protein E2C01_084050 [Portunus trituberculatus]|uniref:Uncharacterized protein n=1 Tax=Portunus trituberculatus TaxID=210409 RepID=A0A5B7J6E9_PORTR|nr:hypothetical protein [Portunus trituberculatus]